MKQAQAETFKNAQSESQLLQNFTGAKIECDLPNAELYKFLGVLITTNNSRIPLTND